MGRSTDEALTLARNELLNELAQGQAHFQNHWTTVEPVINRWWDAYKAWEGRDKFNKAFTQRRMTVRTFPGGEITPDALGPKTPFEKQVDKAFAKGTLNVIDTKFNKETKEDVSDIRIFSDGQYNALPLDQRRQHNEVFHNTAEHDKYWARRGIDSSAFANPANFVSRDKKYEEGLHDLSASLLNPALSIFDQIHNNDDVGQVTKTTWVNGKKVVKVVDQEGSHFSFLPLSEEADQQVLYELHRMARQLLRLMVPALSDKVRAYRAEMTRVKLANEFDMAVSYCAVPANRPGSDLQYRLRYGLVTNTTITGPQGQQTVAVTPDIYAQRRLAARNFKSILGIRDAKNEIVIAIRKHAGPFPVYGVRNGNKIDCYDIVDTGGGRKGMRLNGKTISSAGVMTG